MPYLFYCSEILENKSVSQPVDRYYLSKVWKPSVVEVIPPGVPFIPFAVWWSMHSLHIFTNRDYSLFLIYDNELIIHRSVITPRYFRFPFMGQDDLQIGDTWTAPEYRGKGLATFAIQRILEFHKKLGRKFWYVVEESNSPSIRVVEKAGFKRIGEGERSKRFGMKVFGSYEIKTTSINLS
jgi:RimJ/RimL family protein N-acetyltransferase